MFNTIYQFELKYWLKQPSVYFYGLFFLSISTLVMWGMASESDFEQTGVVINSAANIFRYSIQRIFRLFLFITPGIIGLSIFKDYRSGIHSLLYSFPFNKRDYLLGKFLSAFTITSIIGFMILLGFMIGFALAYSPDNYQLKLNMAVYLRVYFLFIIPNLLFFGVVIFGVITFSRNIYFGYITIVLLILSQQIMGKIIGLFESDFLSALLEPMGIKTVLLSTQSWTIAERNQNNLPISDLLIYNRLLWIGVSILLFIWVYRHFSFRQEAYSFSIKKVKKVPTKRVKLGMITKVILPKVNLNFSLKQQIKTSLYLGWVDFKYIVRSWMFISIVTIGGLAVILILSNSTPAIGPKDLPITSQMLAQPMMFFSGIINLLTFLYVGMLVHRGKLAKTNQLVDISPLPDWVFLVAKISAITLMQIVLLSLLLFGGLFTQIINSYYHFEIGYYFFELFGLNMIHLLLWTLLALFIQSLFDNPFLGFFISVLVAAVVIFGGQPIRLLGFPALAEASIRFNQVPNPPPYWLVHSDLDGYGVLLEIYLTYKVYWLLAGFLLLIGAILLWKRGLTYSIKERLQLVKSRINNRIIVSTTLLIVLFFGTGYRLFQDSYYDNNQASVEERKDLFQKAELKYASLNDLPLPSIKSVHIDLDIYPKSRDFKAKGNYFIINETTQIIDTLVLSYLPGLNTKYNLSRAYEVISKEKVADYIHIDLLKLEQKLYPGDSIRMTFSCQNTPSTWLHRSSIIKGNGTYMEDDIFLRFGNWMDFIRAEKKWATNKKRPLPSDLLHWNKKNQDLIQFEAIISTSENQKAVTSGNLIREWTEGERQYFHYKTDQAMAHSFLFMSGEYSVKKDKWRDIDLEIYYHKDHHYNIDRIMAGMKAALAYCSENFHLYPFKQLRTIEYAQTQTSSAHSFPMSIAMGEGAGFIMDIDKEEDGAIDFAFGTSVHETAHQWWGNALQPTDQLGFKMVAESMAEYVNVMVKKHEKSPQELRNYLHQNMDIYLKERTYDRKEEQPLMYSSSNQNYIHYPKGSLIFYALSDYIGEENLNHALRKFYYQSKAREIPANSLAMVNMIREETPDSLAYIIEDMFETVTLYDNKMVSITSKPLANGQYEVNLEFTVSKYRTEGSGTRSYSNKAGDSLQYQNISSYPLSDYIEIGIFSKQENSGQVKDKDKQVELYLKKHKITDIYNKVKVIVDYKPVSVGIDPYVKLIDLDRGDNRRGI